MEKPENLSVKQRMGNILACALTGICMAANASVASALEFKSVGAAPAILYDAPSLKGKKLFVAPRGMPVEIILPYGDWVKIRDAAGDLSWVENKALSTKRQLVVSSASARVRASADEASPIVLTAEKGVLLEMTDAVASEWIKVRHHEGQTGYVKRTEVWGE